jgi:hypothetical protein
VWIKEVTQGKFHVTDGYLAFRVEGPHSVFLEKAQATWAGGQIYTHALRVDPAHPVVEPTVFFDGIQLKAMTGEIAPGDASGEGMLFGRVPIRIDWPHIVLGKGFLYLGPDGGRLQLLNTKALEGMLSGVSPLIRDRLLEALGDLELKMFKVDVRQEQGAGVASLVLTGQGRQGNRQEIRRFTVNIVGFDALINAYLSIGGNVSFGTD